MRDPRNSKTDSGVLDTEPTRVDDGRLAPQTPGPTVVRPAVPGADAPTPSPAAPVSRASLPPPGGRVPDRLSRLGGLAKQLPPAAPGRRGEHGSDSTVTARIERAPSEETPAPLPPSPANADGWFEQVPTRPAAAPPFEGLGPPGAYMDPTGRMPGRPATGAGPWFGPPHGVTDQVNRWPRNTWSLTALIAATCLAVGMVLGALMFADTSSGPSQVPAGAPCSDDAGAAGEAADAGAPSADRPERRRVAPKKK